MSYSEEHSETFHYFSKEDDEKIQGWLTEHGYRWEHNTVCGNCCGMFSDEYWVNGIGGRFKKEDRASFAEFAKSEGIECSVDGYTIDADPDKYEPEYSIKLP